MNVMCGMTASIIAEHGNGHRLAQNAAAGQREE